MGFFSSILGKARAVKDAVSAAVSRPEKQQSATSPANSVKSMFRARPKQETSSHEADNPQSRTSEPPVIPGATAYQIKGVQVSKGVYDKFRAQGGQPETGSISGTGAVHQPNVFQMMAGQRPDLSGGLTFPAPSLPEGEEAPNIFEQSLWGARTAAEAEQTRTEIRERSLYTYIDKGVGGILPGGEPFTFKPTTVAVIAVVAVLGGALLLSRRR